MSERQYKLSNIIKHHKHTFLCFLGVIFEEQKKPAGAQAHSTELLGKWRPQASKNVNINRSCHKSFKRINMHAYYFICQLRGRKRTLRERRPEAQDSQENSNTCLLLQQNACLLC